jgi:hypothetical protein
VTMRFDAASGSLTRPITTSLRRLHGLSPVCPDALHDVAGPAVAGPTDSRLHTMQPENVVIAPLIEPRPRPWHDVERHHQFLDLRSQRHAVAKTFSLVAAGCRDEGMKHRRRGRRAAIGYRADVGERVPPPGNESQRCIRSVLLRRL